MKLDSHQIADYTRQYKRLGIDGFCNFWYWKFLTIVLNQQPELYVLEISDKFYSLYLKNSDQINKEIAYAFRKIAHRLYRHFMIHDHERKTKHMKFLRLIKE